MLLVLSRPTNLLRAWLLPILAEFPNINRTINAYYTDYRMITFMLVTLTSNYTEISSRWPQTLSINFQHTLQLTESENLYSGGMSTIPTCNAVRHGLFTELYYISGDRALD